MINILLEATTQEIYDKYYKNTMSQELFYELLSLDPTYVPDSNKMGSYGKWIININRKSPLSDEDKIKLKTKLKQFSDVKGALPADKRDIGAIHSLEELTQLLPIPKSAYQLKAEKVPGATFITSTDEWEVYRPDNYEASKFLRGDDAIWCTGRHDTKGYWNSYADRGAKLYIFIRKNPNPMENKLYNRYQASVANGYVEEFRDAGNNPASFVDLMSDKDLLNAAGKTELANTKEYDLCKTIHYSNGTAKLSTIISLKYDKDNGISRCFSDLSKFITKVIVDKGISRLPDGCLKGLSALEEVVFLQAVLDIGENTFRDCSSLKEVIFIDGLKSLLQGTFNGCRNLTKIYLPRSVVYISEGCFNTNDERLFYDPYSALKIYTPRHRIRIPSGMVKWFKKHIVWEDDNQETTDSNIVREQLLKEKFTRQNPKWFNDAISGNYINNITKEESEHIRCWNSSSRDIDFNEVTEQGEVLKNKLINNGFNLNELKLVQDESQTEESRVNDIFKLLANPDPNKMPVFYLSRDLITWVPGSPEAKTRPWSYNGEHKYFGPDIVYIPTINLPHIGDFVSKYYPNKYASSGINKCSPKRLKSMIKDAGYIDLTDSSNFINKEKAAQRASISDKDKYSDYYRKVSGSRVVPVVDVINPQTGEVYDQDIFSGRHWGSNKYWKKSGSHDESGARGINYYKKNGYDIDYTNKVTYLKPKDGYDSSGNLLSDVHVKLKQRLKDLHRSNYISYIDGLYNQIVECRDIIVKNTNEIYSSDLKDIITVSDASAMEKCFSSLNRCIRIYKNILGRLDILSVIQDENKRDEEIDKLFTDSTSRYREEGFGVKDLEDEIKNLKTWVSSINDDSGAYIERFKSWAGDEVLVERFMQERDNLKDNLKQERNISYWLSQNRTPSDLEDFLNNIFNFK